MEMIGRQWPSKGVTNNAQYVLNVKYSNKSNNLDTNIQFLERKASS